MKNIKIISGILIMMLLSTCFIAVADAKTVQKPDDHHDHGKTIYRTIYINKILYNNQTLNNWNNKTVFDNYTTEKIVNNTLYDNQTIYVNNTYYSTEIVDRFINNSYYHNQTIMQYSNNTIYHNNTTPYYHNVTLIMFYPFNNGNGINETQMKKLINETINQYQNDTKPTITLPKIFLILAIIEVALIALLIVLVIMKRTRKS
jgi:hypothetical protein